MTGTKTPSFLSYGAASDAMWAAFDSLSANRDSPKDAWVMQVFNDARSAFLDAAFEAQAGKPFSVENAPWIQYFCFAAYAGCRPVYAIQEDGPCFSVPE